MLADISLPERYEPIRRIARGGMATVWCAADRTLGRRVAIKLLAEPFAHDEVAGRRFQREARAAARLSGHPNVVTIYDVGETPPDGDGGRRPFLVMEYLAGGTVADARRTGHVDPGASLLWLHQAAAALDYAHRRGVIHRDVKLANFLLDNDRMLHVADFGIAQLGSEDTLTLSGEVLGTAAYLAPERALGQPATEASDRYALAVAAFELLVGERPFMAEHFAAQARQHLEEPPPLASLRNPALPRALDAVLVRGMAKYPEDRFPTAGALTDAIDGALAPRPVTRSAPPTAATRPLVATPRSTRPTVAPRAAPAAVASTAAQRTSAARPTRSTVPGRTRARIAVLAALAAVLLGVAIAAGASGGPGRTSHATLAGRQLTHRSVRSGSRAGAKPKRLTATSSSQATSPAPSTTAPAPGSAPGDASALEAQGHALMSSGDYRGAIPVLRQAVAAASPDSLTYAYALYDLGRSLRLAGDPRAAVSILWRRLQIPNQIPVVRTELTLALQALGQQAMQGPHNGHHGNQGGPTPGGQGD